MASLTDEKHNLAENGQVQYGDGCRPNTKSLVVAYLLWFPFGLLGFHRMYLGHWFMGIVYFFTLGYAGIGWIVDGILLPSIVNETNFWLEYWVANPEKKRRLEKCTPQCYPDGLRDRSLRDAYILTLSPYGIMGLQHLYMGHHWYRLAYSISGGLLGVGWISDMFRMPCLVKQSNNKIEQLRNGMSPEDLKHSDLSDCTVLQAYLFAIPGFFGFHHFYLGRWKIGLVYFFTLGLFGVGWLADLIRMPFLVERSNQERKEKTQNTKHVDDAYLLALPLGIFGAHHFYLNRPCVGVLYFFTLGLLGIGWVIDFFRMPGLVREANLRNKQNVFILPTNPQHPAYVISGSTNTLHLHCRQYLSTKCILPGSAPPQNNPYPTAPPHLPPQYTPYSVGYQSVEYPPAYTAAASNDNRPQPRDLKQYPPS